MENFRNEQLFRVSWNGKNSLCNAIKRVRKAENGALTFEETSIDLCPECMKAFDMFMNKGKFGNE